MQSELSKFSYYGDKKIKFTSYGVFQPPLFQKVILELKEIIFRCENISITTIFKEFIEI